MTIPTVTKDRELATGDTRDGVKIKVTDAKGPRSGGSAYSLCYECNKVVYNIWRDGAMAPDHRNRFFCTCEGEQSPIVNQLVQVWDVDDVEKDPKVIKEIREMVKSAKERLNSGTRRQQSSSS
jgi:hypothetical protein